MPESASRRPCLIGPGHLGSHTSAVSLASGVLVALLLLVIPGAIVARTAQLTWPVAVAVGPALTYGVVALAILPIGALGIPWNGWTALVALLLVVTVVASLQAVLRHGGATAPPTARRYRRDPPWWSRRASCSARC